MTNAILPPYASHYLKGNDTWLPSQQHLIFFPRLIMKVGDGRWGRLPTPCIWILEISSPNFVWTRGLCLKSCAIPHDTKRHWRRSFASKPEEKVERSWRGGNWSEQKPPVQCCPLLRQGRIPDERGEEQVLLNTSLLTVSVEISPGLIWDWRREELKLHGKTERSRRAE